MPPAERRRRKARLHSCHGNGAGGVLFVERTVRALFALRIPTRQRLTRMLRCSLPPLRVLLCLLLFAAPSFAQAAGVLSQAEAERWREDLRHMAREMEARHRNLFHTTTRERFEGDVRKLHERIPSLARHQVVVEMARIAASVGDGHTNVAPTRDPKIGFRTLPLKLYLFGDGMFVRAAERS